MWRAGGCGGAQGRWVGHRPLRRCRWPGCRFGQFRRQLCYAHARAWDTHGRPALQRWLVGVRPVDHAAGLECALPGCGLLAELDAGWCRSHHTRWRQRGRPPTTEFVAYCASYGEECFDLRRLPPPMRLEIQYALQCRVDTRRRRAPPHARSDRCCATWNTVARPRCWTARRSAGCWAWPTRIV